MKKSKFRRLLTVFLVILGVLTVLFGCLSPLFFQRDERLSASAAVPTEPPSVKKGFTYLSSTNSAGFGNTSVQGSPEYNFLVLANQANGSGSVTSTIWCQTSSAPANKGDAIWSYDFTWSLNSVVAFYIPDLDIPEQGSGVAEGFNNFVFISQSNGSGLSMYLYYYFAYMEDPEEAYNEGVSAGNEQGYNTGYEEGYNAGVNDNSQYQVGYNTGYQAGYTDGTGVSYSSLNVVSLFLSPVNSFLATPLFGSFSLGTAFSVVLVVLLGAIFIKMFAGG